MIISSGRSDVISVTPSHPEQGREAVRTNGAVRYFGALGTVTHGHVHEGTAPGAGRGCRPIVAPWRAGDPPLRWGESDPSPEGLVGVVPSRTRQLTRSAADGRNNEPDVIATSLPARS